jgi:hypothetical protein
MDLKCGIGMMFGAEQPLKFLFPKLFTIALVRDP